MSYRHLGLVVKEPQVKSVFLERNIDYTMVLDLKFHLKIITGKYKVWAFDQKVPMVLDPSVPVSFLYQ
jgi:hypothetical protein